METYPAERQRAALLLFARTLGSAPRALRRDGCGDPYIFGCDDEDFGGHVSAVAGTLDAPTTPGFMIHVRTHSPMAWTYAKRALSFAAIVNDGDVEGSLFMSRVPTATEAEAIRRYTGVPKRVELSEAELARRRQQFAKVRAA
jgi:hypothetical protein